MSKNSKSIATQQAQAQVQSAPGGGQVQFVSTSGTFSVQSSPLPPPEAIEGYAKVHPELPERLMRMAEQEQKHRHDMESRLLERQFRQAALGSWLGFTIGALGLGSAVACASFGHATTAAIIGAVDLVALVSVFVQGRRSAK